MILSPHVVPAPCSPDGALDGEVGLDHVRVCSPGQAPGGAQAGHHCGERHLIGSASSAEGGGRLEIRELLTFYFDEGIEYLVASIPEVAVPAGVDTLGVMGPGLIHVLHIGACH